MGVGEPAEPPSAAARAAEGRTTSTLQVRGWVVVGSDRAGRGTGVAAAATAPEVWRAAEAAEGATVVG